MFQKYIFLEKLWNFLSLFKKILNNTKINELYACGAATYL